MIYAHEDEEILTTAKERARVSAWSTVDFEAHMSW